MPSPGRYDVAAVALISGVCVRLCTGASIHPEASMRRRVASTAAPAYFIPYFSFLMIRSILDLKPAM